MTDPMADTMTGQPIRAGGAVTVGVAIAIPDPYGSTLQQHRESFGDPLARSIPSHITLLPPTSLPPTRLPPTGLPPRGLPPTGPPLTQLPLTQLPLSQLPPRQRDAVRDVSAHLAEVASRTEPFEIHLRGTASFRPVSPVVFVQVVEGIGRCELLEREVRSGPLTRELSFPYHPHVTVAHDLPTAALDEAFVTLADFECRFDVASLHLYEHGSDGVWRPSQAFAFGGRA